MESEFNTEQKKRNKQSICRKVLSYFSAIVEIADQNMTVDDLTLKLAAERTVTRRLILDMFELMRTKNIFLSPSDYQPFK